MPRYISAESAEHRGSRSREQCFLITFIDQLAKDNAHEAEPTEEQLQAEIDNQERLEEYYRASQEGVPEGQQSQVNVIQGTKVYDNFVSVMTRSPSALVSRLVTQRGLQALFGLSPAQMSAVMPKIKLYKMLYQSETDRNGFPIEFTFGENITAGDMTAMVNTRQGRGGGVGLKSFEWELLGTNTAEIDNNIKARLKIYFQNFTDFVNADILAAHADPSVDFSLDDYLNAKKANYLDLIFRSQKFRDESTGSGEREFNERYYRIKAVLGWSVDQAFVGGQSVAGPGKLFTNNLASQIRQLGTVLLLSLLKHDIDFREDGTIELTLEYHAAVESMLNGVSTNVLYSSQSEILDDMDRLISLYEGELGELQMAEADGEDDSEDPGTESDDEGCETTAAQRSKDEVETRLADLRHQRMTAIGSIHSRFMDTIISNHRMFFVDAPEAYFSDDIIASRQRSTDARIGGAVLDPTQSPEGLPGGDPDDDSGTGGDEEDSEQAADQFGGEGYGASRIPVASDELTQEYYQNVRLQDVATALVTGGQIAGDAPGPTRRVYYMYLGDLIDLGLAATNHQSNPDYGNIRFLVGTISMPTASGANTVINIADIPISVHLFMQFFNDRVIRTGRTIWPVREYIRDILSRLVFPALGSECRDIPEGRGRRRTNIDIIQVSAYGDGRGRDRIMTAGDNNPEVPQEPPTPAEPPRKDPPVSVPAGFGPGPQPVGFDDTDTDGGAPTEFGGRRIYDHQIAELTDRGGLSQHGGAGRLVDRGLYHYVIIQAGDYNEFRRNSMVDDAAERDARDGIYWLNIGNEGGLVKSIKFKKTDQPGLAESRLEREGTIGLGQMREKYDADVSLFGNALFQPGQIIYLNPTVIGLGSPGYATRLSSILGIGGYHQIISVDNAISDKYYETTLDTKWVASGNPTNFDSESEEQECPTSSEIEDLESRLDLHPFLTDAQEEELREERERRETSMQEWEEAVRARMGPNPPPAPFGAPGVAPEDMPSNRGAAGGEAEWRREAERCRADQGTGQLEGCEDYWVDGEFHDIHEDDYEQEDPYRDRGIWPF